MRFNSIRHGPPIGTPPFDVKFMKIYHRCMLVLVVSVAKKFVEAGIDVIIVCDNQNKRHHSKRATILRRGATERGKIQLVQKRIELTN